MTVTAMTREELEKSEECAWTLDQITNLTNMPRGSLTSDLEGDLWMDSMDAWELIVRIEKKYNVKIDEEKMDGIRTVQNVVELMIALRPLSV